MTYSKSHRGEFMIRSDWKGEYTFLLGLPGVQEEIFGVESRSAEAMLH